MVLKFNIESSSRNIGHTVEFNSSNNSWTCTCEHHKFRGAECKHILQAKAQLREVAETGDASKGKNVRVEVEDLTSYANLKNLLALKKELNQEDVDVEQCKLLVEELLLKI